MKPDGSNGAQQVLVVEDDDDIRDIVLLILRMEGYETIGARDGRDALDALSNGLHPAVILLDLRMPNLDGAAFLQWLHGQQGLQNTPVVVLSGEPGAREEALSLGACNFLGKPVDMSELVSAVRAHAH